MWHSLKEPVVELLGLPRDSLHVLFGLVVFATVAVLLRRNPRALVVAWLVLLLVQTINELLDYNDWYRWTQQWNWRETLKDYATTMLLPSLLLLFAWWQQRRKRG